MASQDFARSAYGTRRDLVSLSVAGVPVPDGDGGYTTPYAPLDPPQLWAAVARASQSELERVAGLNSTIIASATHVVRMRFHPAITTQARITWTDRANRAHVANVTGVADVPDLSETVVVVEEIVP
jgi:head-tail adaptor